MLKKVDDFLLCILSVGIWALLVRKIDSVTDTYTLMLKIFKYISELNNTHVQI